MHREKRKRLKEKLQFVTILGAQNKGIEGAKQKKKIITSANGAEAHESKCIQEFAQNFTPKSDITLTLYVTLSLNPFVPDFVMAAQGWIQLRIGCGGGGGAGGGANTRSCCRPIDSCVNITHT